MNLVTKCARHATRLVCGGQTHLAALKKEGNRRYRHQAHEATRLIATGRLDGLGVTFTPKRLVTGWDVA